MNLLWYPVWAFLIVTRLRDRVRCPNCTAVGTYKLHAPIANGNNGDYRPFRWLCKYCGYYRGPEGTGRLCYPSKRFKSWHFVSDSKDEDVSTPYDMVRKDVWPWRG
jgi:hypothetical protein